MLMIPIIFDGKKESEKIKRRLVARISKRKTEGKNLPRLVSILVGDDPASHLYSRFKKKFAREIGIRFEIFHFSQASPAKVKKEIALLNKDEQTAGIMVQLPLPSSWSPKERFLTVETIVPEKDVDGLTSFSLGRLMARRPIFVPAAVKAGQQALKRAGISAKSIMGKNACLISKSTLIGKPFALLLADMGATVTICHLGTNQLEKYTRAADILISATGQPALVNGRMVKKGVIVIDIGAPRGDVDFASVSKKATFITPVPGGIGPLTVACLLDSFVKNIDQQWSREGGE